MEKNSYEGPPKKNQGAQPAEKKHRTIMEVPELKALRSKNWAKEKRISEQKKEIDIAIQNAKKKPVEITKKLTEIEFKTQKEKTAFYTAAALLISAVIITAFLQPSIFFSKTQDQLLLINYSNREIKNISIYSVNEIINGTKEPMYSIDTLNPKSAFTITPKDTTLILAFADRQMPAITVANQKINNDENNIKYKKGMTPQEMLDKMRSERNGADKNG